VKLVFKESNERLLLLPKATPASTAVAARHDLPLYGNIREKAGQNEDLLLLISKLFELQISFERFKVEVSANELS
jgi:hypothetical protein